MSDRTPAPERGAHAGDECLPVFVYGTLRRGEPAEGLVADVVVRRVAARARGRLLDLERPFPAVIFEEAGADVAGELVWLAPERAAETMERLDAYEEAPDLFRRVRIRVRVAGGEVEAFAYEWARSA